MPKKTKKEKIIAEARRAIQQSRTSSSVPSQEQPRGESSRSQDTSYQFTGISEKKIDPKIEATDKTEFTAIRRDIVKTVLLAGAAIAIELVIYVRLGITH